MATDKKSEKFGVTDRSATAPILKEGVSRRIIDVLPSWYSPNALTLTGFVFAASSAFIIWTLMPAMRAGTTLGKTAMMLSALLLIIYAVFDQLDGMQARKLGKSSAFGDFLDHWIDTIIANNLTVPIMVMLYVDQPKIWLMAFLTSLAFWAHNWETRNTNFRELPVVGGLESVWTTLAIMTITALFGVGVWYEQWRGISLFPIVYWYGNAALAWVVIKALRNSQFRLMDYLGFIATLLPICVWHLIFATAYEGDQVVVWAGFIAMGFIATQSTGHLMQHLWLGGNYRSFDVVGFLLGLTLCIGSMFNAGANAPSMMETWLVSLIVFVSIVRVIWQGLSSYRMMLQH